MLRTMKLLFLFWTDSIDVHIDVCIHQDSNISSYYAVTPEFTRIQSRKDVTRA
jgi:hypothetical protein